MGDSAMPPSDERLQPVVECLKVGFNDRAEELKGIPFEKDPKREIIPSTLCVEEQVMVYDKFGTVVIAKKLFPNMSIFRQGLLCWDEETGFVISGNPNEMVRWSWAHIEAGKIANLWQFILRKVKQPHVPRCPELRKLQSIFSSQSCEDGEDDYFPCPFSDDEKEMHEEPHKPIQSHEREAEHSKTVEQIYVDDSGEEGEAAPPAKKHFRIRGKSPVSENAVMAKCAATCEALLSKRGCFDHHAAKAEATKKKRSRKRKQTVEKAARLLNGLSKEAAAELGVVIANKKSKERAQAKKAMKSAKKKDRKKSKAKKTGKATKSESHLTNLAQKQKEWSFCNPDGDCPLDVENIYVRKWVERFTRRIALKHGTETVVGMAPRAYGGSERCQELLETLRQLYLQGFTKEQVNTYKKQVVFPARDAAELTDEEAGW